MGSERGAFDLVLVPLRGTGAEPQLGSYRGAALPDSSLRLPFPFGGPGWDPSYIVTIGWLYSVTNPNTDTSTFSVNHFINIKYNYISIELVR